MLLPLQILVTAASLLAPAPSAPPMQPLPTPPAAPAPDPDPQRATIELRIVQVDLARIAEIERTQGATLETSPRWGVSMGISIGDGLRLKPPVFELGDQGELRIGGRVWALGAALDDARRGIVGADSPFTVLTAPRVACEVGQRAVVSMGSTVEWMVAEDGGCLRMADDRDGPAIEEGVEIQLRLASLDAKAMELDPVDVRLRRVVRRDPVPDVSLAVGRPAIQEDRLRRDVRLLAGRVAVIPLTGVDENSGDLLLVVISRVDEAAER